MTFLKQKIELSSAQLDLQQKIYQAEVVKHKHQQTSTYELQKATEDLKKAFGDSMRTQIEYRNTYDQLQQLAGMTNTQDTLGGSTNE